MRHDDTATSVREQRLLKKRVHEHATSPGVHFPPGATVDARGVNFSIFAPEAAIAELRLYEGADSDAPSQTVVLDNGAHRTFSFWHVYVEGLKPAALYTWRVAPSKEELKSAPELFDPWAHAASAARWNRKAVPSERMGRSLRAIVTAPIDRTMNSWMSAEERSDAVIYEVHVGGFTRHASSGVRHPGTFAGFIEKIPYLKELGITHVEFLPVMAFDEQDVPEAVDARGLRNYWGYSSYGFYAPHPRYCVDPAAAPREFADCVRALHAAGLRVLLDAAFNHTAEGGLGGPTINFKALANGVFYHRDAANPSQYRDYTGCGNTVNCNHPLVTNFIVNCLEYWATEFGVDGFRFDLASIFTRGENGAPLANPPMTWAIELSRTLATRPMIAEAWDADGLFQVGSFPGMRWAEWNGRYRDTLRRFVRGDPGLIGEVATRIAGSQDLYANRSPLHSINFATCHDGFTLYDLVSHNHKHNDSNGEGNRDGNNDNLSWNCGAEGDTDNVPILALRKRQAKNLMAILFLSQGVPMILAGDEVLRSQRGNNNAYCQDSELSWFDWHLLDANRDMLRFVRELIALRRRHPCLRRRRFLTGRPVGGSNLPDIAWHGEHLNDPRWNDGNSRLLAFTLAGTAPDEKPLHVIMNMAQEPRTVAIPVIANCKWRRTLDTALASPNDIGISEQSGEQRNDSVNFLYSTGPRSVVVLEAE